MKLLFLHGAPAAGKLTTAKAVLRRVSGRLFDNHVAIDLARTVFEFGTPAFWELVDSVRISTLTAAAENSVPLLVMTFVYVEPDDLPTFERFEAIAQQRGGELHPVYLQCSTEEIVRRIGNPDRVAKKKMSSEQGARNFMAQHRVCEVPRPTCLVLDSEKCSADENAEQIIGHFGLAAALTVGQSCP
jgi:hypothetical protein